MEEQIGTCFITGEECPVTDVIYDGQQYLIKEDLADEYPLKKLREMIADKIKTEKDKKEAALAQLKTAAEALGVDPEAFEALLLGQGNNQKPSPAKPQESQPKSLKKEQDNKDDGFKEVDGELKSSIRANVRAEDGVTGSLPAYSKVEDGDGRKVVEENKKVKRVDENTVITDGSLGRLVVKMNHRSGHEVDRMLRQVDEDGNLIRAAITTTGDQAAGVRTVECPLCRGSGITRVGAKMCPKCEGSGFVTS